MIPIFLASVTPYAGKNVIALGIAQKLRRQNKSVGYFKPIGPLPTYSDGVFTDEDAVYFKKMLNLDEQLDTLCPFVLSDETVADLLRGAGLAGGAAGEVKNRVLSSFKIASSSKDFMLVVNMGRLSCGLTFGYPMHEFIRDVNARVIVVDRYRWPMETLDGIIHIKNLVPDQFAGVVFNRIPTSKTSHIDQAVRPFLKSHGVEVLGVVPDDAVLSAVPVSKLVEALDGKVLCCGDKLDKLVERFSIGAMNAEAALRFFQRVPRKAVITGGDRADIQLAALQTSTHCLILTGDLYPNERILSRAEELGVPVILVAQDTSLTAEVCDRLHGHLSLHMECKINRASELVDECLDWPALNRHLGID